ncbi:MAG: bifunctional riboflavin kinase/FAD synthetase [Trichlorobacter sp.]|uniref:bifunctional riboflavin kinase/FAD synthetase n=1 Tax=Trichlorobacter sp. TaxID=2911007 RepID=UPI00255F3843|nr:bifunctional riboflavin kinase/FAD synthetase [Trichlorobacter sp.]MDK9717472.1 bifunctional riboflavin kinase/FAD synthetase [Trichlorobacter sp.]
MRTMITNNFSRPLADRSVVTIGNFDGVHRGHREIFRQVTNRAKELSALSVVVTFTPHPLRVLRPDDRRFCLITTDDQKRELIAESDIDLLLVIPFSKEFSELSADFFVRRVLHTCLGVRFLVIGHDYAFGSGREGNESFLVKMGRELNFEVQTLDPVGDDGILFSSTAVRQLVTDGIVAGALQILGRCHRISGQVVHGREIGRSLGFPTANIVTHNELIPGDGVYAVWVSVLGELFMGACSVGVNPTFGGGQHTIEVFLFDFSADLYGQDVVIHFVDKLRDIKKFSDKAALMSQIFSDVATARNILASGLPAEYRQ